MSDQERNDRWETRHVTEVSGWENSLGEPNLGDFRGPDGMQHNDFNDIVLRINFESENHDENKLKNEDDTSVVLSSVENNIFERIKYLDKLRDCGKSGRPVSEGTLPVAERHELISCDTMRVGKNRSAATASLDDMFLRIQVRLDWLYKSEDAVLNHRSDQWFTVEYQMKSLQHEVDVLRTRMAEKRDELTTAKMKIDELRVLKNDSIYSATSQLQEKLEKMTVEYKQCSQLANEQNHEIKKLKELTEYLKNTLSVYESKLADKNNTLGSINIGHIHATKATNMAEKSIGTQTELTNKISQISTLSTGHNDSRNNNLCRNIDNHDSCCIASENTIADTHGSENEQLRLTTCPTRLINGHTNIITHNSISEKLKSSLSETESPKDKTTSMKVTVKDAEHTEQEFNELQDINKMLTLEKNRLENDNCDLLKNEALLVEKLNDVMVQLEKKQETIATFEILGPKLRAEIQPLQCIKDNLETQLSTLIHCNQEQLEKIERLEMINNELKHERDHFFEINQKNIDKIKSLKQDDSTFKKELLNIERLKSEVEEFKNNNVILLNEIDTLKLYNDRYKNELERNSDLRRVEQIRYQNLLAEEGEEKHHTDIELLKTVKALQLQISEQQKCICSKQENKKFETKRTFSDFDSKNISSDTPVNTVHVLEVALEYEQKKNEENKKQIEDKNTEIEHLNYIKYSLEKEINDYALEIKDKSSENNKLQLTLDTLKSYATELEDKIELFRTEKLNKINYDDKLKKLEYNLIELFSKNQMLSNELTEVLDVIEKTDQKLIEAHREIVELETHKKKNIVLTEELNVKNQIIEAFTLQSRATETVLKDHQAKADKDKREFEIKLLDYTIKVENAENKYNEIVNEYESIKKQKSTESMQLISEQHENLKLKLEVSNKNTTSWAKKYEELLNENRIIHNEFENLNVKFKNAENYIKELEKENESFKTKGPCEINEDVLRLETVNASLNKKLAEFYEKYSKNRAHLEEIKTMITNHNLKSILQENIDLCNTRDKLQREILKLKWRCQDLSGKLLPEKGENNWPVIDYRNITKLEALYHALVWQKTYLMKFTKGKDELLRLIIQEAPGLDKSTIIESLMRVVYATKKTSRFK